MAAEATVKLLLDLDQTNFKTGIDQSAGSVKKFGIGLATLTTGSAILGGIGSSAISMSVDFEQSFAKVSTLFGDVKVDTKGLEDQITSLSARSGIASTELNEGLYQALSAGIPVTEDMSGAMEFLEKSTQLATAGFTTTDKAVDVSTTVLNAYGLSIDDTDSVMNTLIETQNAGKTTVDELASSLGKVIPTASSLGVNFQELSGMVAKLTASGLTASESVTGLKAAFTEMIDPTTQVNEVWRELDDSVTGGSESIKDYISQGGDITTALSEISGYLSDNNIEWSQVIGSTEGAAAAQSLFADGGEELKAIISRLSDDNYELAAAYDTMGNTSQQNADKIKQGINNALKGLGDIIMDTVGPALQFLADHAGIVGVILVVLAIIVGVLAFAVGVVLVKAFVKVGLEALKTGAKMLIGWLLGLGPIGLIILAVIGVILVILLLKDKITEWMGWWHDAWQKVTEHFKGTFFGPIIDLIGQLGNIFGGVIDFIIGVFTGDWGRAWDGVVNIFKGIFNGIVDIIKQVLNIGIGLVNKFFDMLSTPIKIMNKIPGVNVPTIPHIPYLATGGIVTGPTQAMIGEGGNPEAVIPLNSRGAKFMSSIMGGNGSQKNVSINVEIGQVNDVANVSELSNELLNKVDVYLGGKLAW